MKGIGKAETEIGVGETILRGGLFMTKCSLRWRPVRRWMRKWNLPDGADGGASDRVRVPPMNPDLKPSVTRSRIILPMSFLYTVFSAWSRMFEGGWPGWKGWKRLQFETFTQLVFEWKRKGDLRAECWNRLEVKEIEKFAGSFGSGIR